VHALSEVLAPYPLRRITAVPSVAPSRSRRGGRSADARRRRAP